MEDILVLERPVRTTGDLINTNLKRTNTSLKRTNTSSATIKNIPVHDKLAGEVDENFLNYLNCHGLANEDNLLVLPSTQHYYYDYEELKEVTTIINLKKINLIKHLDDFLHTLYNGLSPRTNFIGCFSDLKTQKGVSMTSRLYKRFINFLDSRIDVEIDSKEFSRLLESHGFKIIDMTEINGLTYFRTQNHTRTAV